MNNCCNTEATKPQSENLLSKEDICPQCGKEGQAVKNITVKSLVKEAAATQVDEEDYFLCLNSNCEVVYFNNDSGKTFFKKDVAVRVWFKEKDDPIPVCYCANVTEKEIREEIIVKRRAKNLKDIKEHTGAMTGGRCLYANPTSKCCGAVVNQVINKALADLEKNDKG